MTAETPKIILLFSVTFLFLFSCRQKENRLAKASSPYLQQHADNPVDWYEWGEEALQKAKKENKPLLISVGYASCHWCHVMEKESFMDTAVARVMNEHFICIKVDREERPDLDNIYINACQLISGNSGWPLNAFALPDGKPFFAGTYYSRQSWLRLLQTIAAAYKQQHAKVVLQANSLAFGIANLEIASLGADSDRATVDMSLYQKFFDSLYQKIDLTNGGLRGTPKFPMPSMIEFLLQYAVFTGDQKAVNAATNTLTKMALGGLYDQLGGGFARYATDSLWHIPHFEKMLYDNGQLMSAYAHAYQLTRNDLFKNIVNEIAVFAERELTAPDGGFYSSLNAETEQGEGVFYSWEYDEFIKNAGPSAKLITAYYNVSENGNWKNKKNILYASSTPDDFALKNAVRPSQFYNILLSTKKKLLAERNKRQKPRADEKILTSWNALMLNGFLDAYAALGEKSYLDKALANARFIEKNLYQKNGQLWHSFTDGKVSVSAFLEDYAFLAKAYIRLYQLNFDKHWLTLARQLTDYAIKNFFDPESGMFFYTASGSKNVIVRKMLIVDEAIASSNAVMAEVLYLLGVYFEDSNYSTKSTNMLSKMAKPMNSRTQFFSRWCLLAGMYANGTYEVAIVGKDALAKNLELQKHYLPQSIYFGSTQEENLPLLQNKVKEGKTLIYVCVDKTCKRPVESVDNAFRELSFRSPNK
jgi:uncharacterized protein YyaL (SSP411 family)